MRLKSRHLDSIIFVLLFSFAFFTILISYFPITGGTFLFDESTSLSGVNEIESWEDAHNYVTSGIAGPTGRPISLATFIPNGHYWPYSAAPFLYENILIHCLNLTLMIWLAWLVNRQQGRSSRQASFNAVIAGLLWASLPILASSSYMVVQRMTLLSATFTLIGLIGYTYGNLLAERKPLTGIAMSMGLLGVGTILATFSKENGALTPIYAFALSLILPSPAPRLASRIQQTLLLLPISVIFAYLIYRIPTSTAVVRDFSWAERLSTQGVVLWEYVLNSFLPNAFKLGPFHDHREALQTWHSITGIMAWSGWAILLAVSIIFRKKLSLVLFSVIWFLGGHLLESSSLMLELYFEHRNYTPLMGPCLAAGIMLGAAPQHHKKTAGTFFITYLGLHLFVLNNVTRTVSNPIVSSTIWHERFVASPRAAQYASTIEKSRGFPDRALRIIDETLEYQPEEISLQLQKLLLTCEVSPQGEMPPIDANLFQTGRYNYSVFALLSDLGSRAWARECKALDARYILDLSNHLLKNPGFQANWHQATLHKLRSQQHHPISESDLKAQELRKAWSYFPELQTAIDLVTVYRIGDQDCDAMKFLQEVIRTPPTSWPQSVALERQSLLQKYLHSLPSNACSLGPLEKTF